MLHNFPDPMGEPNNLAEVIFWISVAVVLLLWWMIASRRDERRIKGVDELAAADRKKGDRR